MTSIAVSQKLRPLKIAFVVRPGDFAALERVVELNSLLWGGRYNPVLPLYKRMPPQLRDAMPGSSARDLFSGSLEFFDPDFLVLCDGIKASEIDAAPCQTFELNSIKKDLSKKLRPGLGIFVLEILKYYYMNEEKFVRKNKIDYVFPAYGANHRYFLKAVFGNFSDDLPRDFVEDTKRAFDAQDRLFTINNYTEWYNRPRPYALRNIHNISSYKANIDTVERGLDQSIIYYLDPASFIDIVSYLNLRAAGCDLLPIAKQIGLTEPTKAACLRFIEEESWVHPENSAATTHVTLQKSPSIDETDVDEFYKHLSPPKFEGGMPRCLIRHWIPPYWSRWHQDRGEVTCASISAAERDDDVAITNEKDSVSVDELRTDLFDDERDFGGRPLCAIDIEIRNLGSTEFEAGIIPSGSDDVARSCGMFGRHQWLIKKSGITYFPNYKSRSRIWFQSPNAQDVFFGWLKARGWEAEVSDAGKVAYQMLRHLGGPRNIAMMTSRSFVDFFSNGSFAHGKAVVAKEFIHKVTGKIYDDLGILWGKEKFLKALLKSKIVQLGSTLQCDRCSRRSWHPISELDYSVRCPHCLSDFEIPTHKPTDIRWSYKTIGPFSAPDRAAGAYAVLLTAHFFERTGGSFFEGKTTTVLSFKAKKGDDEFESDLALFCRDTAPSNRALETIFCECKTFSRFEQSDVDKLERIGDQFPGSILVLATLKERLSDQEKSAIAPFVKSRNKYVGNERPLNPVMVLTGRELFSRENIRYGKNKLGGLGKKRLDTLLDICQATQQQYLGLPSWHHSWSQEWKKQAKRKKKRADVR